MPNSNKNRDGTCQATDGAELAYTLHAAPHSKAPRLVLIHSLALDRSFWDGVVEKLAPLAEILVYDCRGHGRSDRRAGPYTTELFADDLASLLDHVGWAKAIVAGCSMGGCVAQAFAARYPQRALAVGLIDTTACYGADAPKAWRERAGQAREKGLESMSPFQATRWFGERFRAERPDLVEATLRVFLANDIECYAATCVMLGDADLRPGLERLSMPVAILVGEEDYATPVAMAEQLHAAIPHSSLRVLAGARHLTPIESPTAIASGLMPLLEQA